MVSKAIKKPVIIEYVQMVPGSYLEVKDFLGDKLKSDDTGNVYIETLEGNTYPSINDYIIKGIAGEFYSCKPDIFEATYEKLQ
jgi:hypothetical protein